MKPQLPNDKTIPRLTRLPEKNVPSHAGFSPVFKALKQAHSSLCNCLSNAEDGRKEKREGTFFDRNRLTSRLGYQHSTGLTAGVDPNYTCIKTETCADVMGHLNNIESQMAQLYACMKKKAC
jgi:hypothetical protein